MKTLKGNTRRNLNIYDVLVRPRLTEKAADLTEKGVYVFVVKKEVTKDQVRRAVKELYKFDTKKINMVAVKGKVTSSRRQGGAGKKSDIKKAYVYLKKGDKIQLT